MMDLKDIIVLVKGGGDMGSGAAWKLFRSGIKVAVIDLPNPLCVRRQVAFSTAIADKTVTVDGVAGRLIKEIPDFIDDYVPVFTTEQKHISEKLNPHVLVDATLKAIDNRTTNKGDAPLTIGLGPGFKAPDNIDCVIETNRRHHLGRVIWEGEAEEYTGIPDPIEGYTNERLIRAPASGRFKPLKKIGDVLQKNDIIGWVNRSEIRAGVHGIIRGLVAENMHVEEGFKMGDIDPRGIKEYVYTVSDKARNLGGGVLEAVLYWYNTGKFEKAS
ncbi:selenium-dependent molybdenum cofactor biosynthesis protein YqeB [Elusimicrobiota bacterium]